VAAIVEEVAEDQNLFHGFDDERETADVTNDSPSVFGDDMPPPVYQPEAQRSYFDEPTPEEYVAPQAPAAGTPSPEAMARLHAAIQKAPMRAQGSRPPANPAAAAQSAERPRFGINSLINRMTGHSSEAVSAEPRPAPRQEPQVRAFDDEVDHDPEQEKIEIPAFLRRQAN